MLPFLIRLPERIEQRWARQEHTGVDGIEIRERLPDFSNPIRHNPDFRRVFEVKNAL
jgi:hypothetical protein